MPMEAAVRFTLTPVPAPKPKKLVQVVYKSGTNKQSQAFRNKEIIKGTLTVMKGVYYMVTAHVLRNDMASSSEKLATLTLDGKSVLPKGGCNPPGSDYACDFYKCPVPKGTKVMSKTGKITVALNVIETSWDCDCDKKSWKCSPEKKVKGRTPMEAAVRFTLTPVPATKPSGDKTLSGGNSGAAKNLKACTGECDADTQCAKGLKCFQRSKGEPIPGCKGNGGGKDWDYCYDPKTEVKKPAPKVKCAAGSASSCKVTTIKTPKYSAGNTILKVTGGRRVKKSTDKNSCPTGYKIWSPRNKNDWTIVYNAMKKSYNNYPRKPHLIIDVTRAANKCGGCNKYAMKSGVSQQAAWKTSDGSKWWLRDARYNEPNGDYHANCYLHVSNVNPNDVRFNDHNCNIASTDYLCQKAQKKKPTKKPTGCGAPAVNWKTAADNKAPKGWKISGFNGNVGNSRLCANGWNAYANGNNQGTLSAKINGSGTVTIKYRDCWKEGHASVFLNGKLKGQSANKNGALKTTTFAFKNGDTLSFKDTGNNGVLHIVSITYKCGGGGGGGGGGKGKKVVSYQVPDKRSGCPGKAKRAKGRKLSLIKSRTNA